MEKNNLLKILGIVFLVSILLTWLIPIGSYVDNVIQIGSIQPLGFFDIFYIPLYTVLAYSEYAVVILMIGALYGVFHKTGVYGTLVNKTAKKFKKKQNFLVLSVLLFSTLASLTGLTFPILILIPFFISVVLKLGYNRMTALASTVGAILAGLIGTTFGVIQTVYDGALYSINLFERMGAGINDKLVMRILIFAIVVFLYAITVLYNAKKETKTTVKNEEKVKETKKVASKKSVLPMFVSLVLLTVLSIFTMYHWDYILNGTTFANFDSTLVDTTIAGNISLYSILGNTLSQIGTFGNLQLISIILLFIVFISFVYGLSVDDTIEGMKDGFKVALKVALFVTLANIVMMVINHVSNGSIIVTMTKFVADLFDGFNVISTTLFSVVGGLLYNNFYDFVLDSAVVTHQIAATQLEFSVFALNMQTVFNTLMMILPTSMILIAGLTYLDIKYKDWLKYIWKYVLEIFAIAVIFSQITYMLF